MSRSSLEVLRLIVSFRMKLLCLFSHLRDFMRMEDKYIDVLGGEGEYCELVALSVATS